MPTHRITVEERGDETHIRFVDPKIIDKPNIEEIFEQVFHLVDRRGRRNLRLDFTNIDYLSSAALGKLVSLQKKLQAADGTLKLCHVPDAIFKVIEIACLASMFDIDRIQAQGATPHR